MTYVGLNTICPVCGDVVPESMPPMEVLPSGPGADQGLAMLRVCCSECRLIVLLEPELYYRAAKSNTKAR